MSCYFRHMKDVLSEAGVEVTEDNKKAVDRAVHELAGVEYKSCSPTWKAVKEKFLADDKRRASFIKKLRQELGV